jgi:hypothetical protein
MIIVNPQPLNKKQNEVMKGFIEGSRPAGKPRCRWKDAIWQNSLYFLQIRNCKAAARKREG